MKPRDILTTDGLAERLQVKRSSVYEKCRLRASHSGAATPCLNLRRYLPFYGPDVCEWLRNGEKHRENSLIRVFLAQARSFEKSLALFTMRSKVANFGE